MEKNEILEEILDKTGSSADVLDSIYGELTTQGCPTIKGLLLEIERRGANIEDKILPNLYNQLLDIEKAILVSALVIAHPKDPSDVLAKAYRSVEHFLKNKGKSAF